LCVNSIFAGEQTPPPASKQAVKDLSSVKATAEQEGHLLQFRLGLVRLWLSPQATSGLSVHFNRAHDNLYIQWSMSGVLCCLQIFYRLTVLKNIGIYV